MNNIKHIYENQRNINVCKKCNYFNIGNNNFYLCDKVEISYNGLETFKTLFDGDEDCPYLKQHKLINKLEKI
jgi:hypothetical protein